MINIRTIRVILTGDNNGRHIAVFDKGNIYSMP